MQIHTYVHTYTCTKTGPRKRGRVGDAVKVAGVRDFQTSNATRKRPNPSSNSAGRDDNKRLRNLIIFCDKRLKSTREHSTRGRKKSEKAKVSDDVLRWV